MNNVIDILNNLNLDITLSDIKISLLIKTAKTTRST